MVVDTETATLPFVSEMNLTADEKKKIAIAMPLVYDIGWTITNRKGEILDKKQFLIAETFSVPSIFNTAYYAEKRPIYIDMLNKGETTIKPWREVMTLFMEDMRSVKAVGAFNAMFDFKKAIPFTDNYIDALYSSYYNVWENNKRTLAKIIISEPKKNKNDKEFNKDFFNFRGESFVLFDLWGLAVNHILNNNTYKSECVKRNNLTASGIYFKSSAETTYQYICNKYDFIESHTALDDAIIETAILARIAKKHSISQGIDFFPFRNLGCTDDFVCNKRNVQNEELQIVYDAINNYIESHIDYTNVTPYIMGLIYRLNTLARKMQIECPY